MTSSKTYLKHGEIRIDEATTKDLNYMQHGDRHPAYEWFEPEGLVRVRTIDWGPQGKTGWMIIAALIVGAILGGWYWMR